MSAHGSCCHAAPGRRGLARRGLSASGWLLPSALFVLLPKCPLCFAATFALVTGVGLSASAAASARTGLLVLAAASLALLATRLVRRRLQRVRAARCPVNTFGSADRGEFLHAPTTTSL